MREFLAHYTTVDGRKETIFVLAEDAADALDTLYSMDGLDLDRTWIVDLDTGRPYPAHSLAQALSAQAAREMLRVWDRLPRSLRSQEIRRKLEEISRYH